MKISDERLAKLIYNSRLATEFTGADNFIGDEFLSICVELQSLRSTEQRVMAMLNAEKGREIELGPRYACLTRHDGATTAREVTADTPFAALAELVEEGT